MKRNLLALAVGVAFVLPLAAQAAPTVYGRLNLSVDYMDIDAGTKTDSGWALNSNSSRVGIKGNEKLTDELTAVYKAEWEVSGDSTGFVANGGADLMARERYIGLKHYQLGTVRLGHIDSPLKNAEDSVDVFNDHVNLDMGKFIYGQNRLSNSINYVSPKFLDVFGANVSFMPGEKATGTGTCGAACENHLADAYSAAFSYEDDSLYLSVSMDKEVTEMDAMRLNARYKINELTLSGMYQTAENSFGASNEQESFVLSASYNMDKWTARAEYLQSNKETFNGFTLLNSQVNTSLLGGGLDYNFTQSTKAYVNLAGWVSDGKTGQADKNRFLAGVGMETRF